MIDKKTRIKLRSLASTIKPIVWVGKDGFTDNVLNQISEELFNHAVSALSEYCGDDFSVSMALLLHEIGDQEADGVLRRLKFDNSTRHRVVCAIKYHKQIILETRPEVKRWMRKLGADDFLRVLKVKLFIHYDSMVYAGNAIRCMKIMERVLKDRDCYTLYSLYFTGHDVLACGIPEGKTCGEVLNKLLDMVIDGEVENEYSALKAAVIEMIKSGDYCLA